MAMLDQQSIISNSNHQSMPDKEQLRAKLRQQLNYYFSRENIINDIYLQSQMDADNYVPIIIIANFKLVKRLTHDLRLITDVLKELQSVEVDAEEKKVRSSDKKIYLPARKRCIIILRNVPLDATENEVSELFSNEHCPVSAVEYERVLESDHSDCWYITFNNEDDAQKAFFYLTQKEVSIRGQKVLARMKTRLWQKPTNNTVINPSTPPNSSFTPLQQQYTPVSMQSSLLGNIPQQHLPNNYNVNTLFDRATAYQQNMQPSLSFSYNSQPPNMSSYSIANHQQGQFYTGNHPVFPTNVWYIPQITDPYSTMIVPLNSLFRTYNGVNTSKVRMTRDYQSTYKPHNSTKQFSNQNSRHEVPSTANSHTNELIPSCQNSTPHSDDTNSSGLDNESLSNHTNNSQPIEQQEVLINEIVTHPDVSSAIDYNPTSSFDNNDASHTYSDTLKMKELTITNDSNKS